MGQNPDGALKLKLRVVEFGCGHQASRCMLVHEPGKACTVHDLVPAPKRHSSCSCCTQILQKNSMLTLPIVNRASRPDKGKKAAGVGRLAKVAFDEVLGGSSGYG